MKTSAIIISFLFGILMSSNGQEIELINTKELINISNNEGLLSAIAKVDNFPLHYIDRKTTQELLRRTLTQPYSKEIESFLIGYSSFDRMPEVINPLNNLIKKKTYLAEKDSVANYNEIDWMLLNAVLTYYNQETESSLIDYYKTWLKLAKRSRINYMQGKSDAFRYKDSTLNIAISNKIHDLMEPYKVCNYNCYLIMRTLEKMRSSFPEKKRLEYHKRIGEATNLSFNIERRGSNPIYKNRTPKAITLSKKCNSIKDIEFVNELNFKNMYLKDINSNFGIYGLYNQKSGIIVIHDGHIYNYYLIKLLENKTLQIHETNICMVISD